jgi:hypothetical protein
MNATPLVLFGILFVIPLRADDQGREAPASTTAPGSPRVDSSTSAKPAPPLLVDELNNEIDRRIAVVGSDPGNALSLFSSADDSNFVYVRNPSNWVHDLDLTGVVITHDYICQNNHLTSGGALITPQDVVCAAHFAIPNGAVLNFVDLKNVIHTGKVVSTAVIAGTDICICHLESAVLGVKAYKVLPPNYAAYGPYNNLTGWPVLLAYNFGHRAFVLDCYRIFAELGFHPCTEPSRIPYTTGISSGSGSPAFAVINGEPIIVGCLHTVGSTSWVAGHEAAINTTLSSLGSTYTLTTVNLSSPVSYLLF